jgi:phage shock protein PspC (stress-responsive transcriptional regulator)
VIGGVCSGLSVATGVDVTLVRLAFIAVGLTGVGVLAYILLLALVPREDTSAGRPLRTAPPETAKWLRVAMLVAPIVALTGLVGGPWRGPFLFNRFPFGGLGGLGLVLIVAGVLAIWFRRRETGSSLAAAAPGGTQVTGTPGPAWWQTRPEPLPPPQPLRREPVPPAAAPTPRPRTPVGLVVARVFAWLAVIGAVVAGAVLVWLEAIGALSIPVPVVVIGSAVVAIGVIVAAAIWARHAMAIVGSMLTLAVPLVLVVTLGAWNGGVGDHFVAPTALAAMQEYRTAIGRLTVDLSHATLPTTATVKGDTKVGVLEVVVPSDASLIVNAHVGAGQSRLFGAYRSGLNVTDHLVLQSPGGSATVTLDLNVAAGQLTVCRVPNAGQLPARGCEGVLARSGY